MEQQTLILLVIAAALIFFFLNKPTEKFDPMAIGAVVYEHANYQGFGLGLRQGLYDSKRLQSLKMNNNVISSIKITPGYAVRIFKTTNFTGPSVRLTKSMDYVGDDFNDKIGSLVVGYDEAAAKEKAIKDALALEAKKKEQEAALIAQKAAEEAKAQAIMAEITKQEATKKEAISKIQEIDSKIQQLLIDRDNTMKRLEQQKATVPPFLRPQIDMQMNNINQILKQQIESLNTMKNELVMIVNKPIALAVGSNVSPTPVMIVKKPWKNCAPILETIAGKHHDWCENDYGAGYKHVGGDSAGCTPGFGKGICEGPENMVSVPSGTRKLWNNCVEWWDADGGRHHDWCTNDLGPGWKHVGRDGAGCRWGQGKGVCEKI